MGLISAFLRNRRKITDFTGVEDFLDANAAFLINRTFYEYSRARSGILSAQLLKEKEFQAAIEDGRWRAYPIGLSHMGELVEGRLRTGAEARGVTAAMQERVIAAALNVARRYRTPDGFPAEFWDEARADVERRLRLAGLAAPKAAQDIAVARFQEIFDLSPLHPEVRKHDFDVIQTNLRGTMLSIAAEWDKRADLRALVDSLA